MREVSRREAWRGEENTPMTFYNLIGSIYHEPIGTKASLRGLLGHVPELFHLCLEVSCVVVALSVRAQPHLSGVGEIWGR